MKRGGQQLEHMRASAPLARRAGASPAGRRCDERRRSRSERAAARRARRPPRPDRGRKNRGKQVRATATAAAPTGRCSTTSVSPAPSLPPPHPGQSPAPNGSGPPHSAHRAAGSVGLGTLSRQRLLQRRRAGEAIFRRGCGGAGHDIIEPIGHPGHRRAWPIPDAGGRRSAAVGQLAREGVVEGEPQGIQVGARVAPPSGGDLGGHVIRRAGKRCPVAVTPSWPSSLAEPKSVRRKRPSGSSRTFCGFTSRWRIPRRCAAASAAARSRPRRTA